MRYSSLRCPIPKEMRDQLAEDKYMSRCLIGGQCEGRIQWHHSLTYAGRRVNELYAIHPMCEKHHREEARYRDRIEKATRKRIFHFKAADDFKAKYPRSKLL